MKLKRSLYSILQYISTIDDIFTYLGNGYIIAKEKSGSGFVEVKAPIEFFKEPIVIKSLSKFLRLFTFDKKDKDTDPSSIQDWVLEKTSDYNKDSLSEMYIKSSGRVIKIHQGSPGFLEKRNKDLVSKIDNIVLEDSIKFQLSSTNYKQIMSDAALLDLDRITFISENDDVIRTYITKTGKGTADDFSSYQIDCVHKHTPTKISFPLSSFSLIDATDHQLEFGKYKTGDGNYVNILKVKSFCTNDLVVQKLILSDRGA